MALRPNLNENSFQLVMTFTPQQEQIWQEIKSSWNDIPKRNGELQFQTLDEFVKYVQREVESWNGFSFLEIPIAIHHFKASLHKLTTATQEQDFKQALQNIVGQFENNKYIRSDTELGQFLIRLNAQHPDRASGAISYLFQNAVPRNMNKETLLGVLEAVGHDSPTTLEWKKIGLMRYQLRLSS